MIKNKIQELLAENGETRYRFWKRTNLAQRTAYHLADDPFQIPTGEVLNAICEAYGVSVGEVLEHIPDKQANEPVKKIAA